MIRADGIDRVGIEIEKLTEGERRKRLWFESHIRNDVMKLLQQNGLREGYVLVFTYHDPDFEFRPFLESLTKDMGIVRLAYLRLNTVKENGRTSPLGETIEIPEGWLNLAL